MADFTLELENGAESGRVIVGVDEVGRGPWAGPVVTAAVWLPEGALPEAVTAQLDDSKKLSRKKRDALSEILLAASDAGKICHAFGEATAEEVDRLNVLAASLAAMSGAVQALGRKLGRVPDLALVDGNRLPGDLCCPGLAVVKGDGRSWSIAAASILAKTRRDAQMAALALDWPGYGWERNAGYGTKEHQEGLKKLGLTPWHRRSFRPVAALLAAE